MNLQEEREEFGVNMKIKYKLIYEWTSEESDILEWADANEYSIDEAIDELIQWNIEEYCGRMETRAANILDHYTSNFEYEVVDDK